jgi:hypothetical protein
LLKDDLFPFLVFFFGTHWTQGFVDVRRFSSYLLHFFNLHSSGLAMISRRLSYFGSPGAGVSWDGLGHFCGCSRRILGVHNVFLGVVYTYVTHGMNRGRVAVDSYCLFGITYAIDVRVEDI